MAKCKYPNEVCANMTVLNGETYCDSVPCTLKDEIPKQTNADRIQSMSIDGLAGFLADITGDVLLRSTWSKDEWHKWLQSESGGIV